MSNLVGSSWYMVNSRWDILVGGCVKNAERVLISGLLNEQKNVYKFVNNFCRNIFCVKKDFIKLVLQNYSKTIYTYIISIFNQLIISFYTVSTIPITNTVILNNK